MLPIAAFGKDKEAQINGNILGYFLLVQISRNLNTCCLKYFLFRVF
jgi:hypothetical protein